MGRYSIAVPSYHITLEKVKRKFFFFAALAGRNKLYSLFRMIFPLMVLGSSSLNTTIRGYL